MLIGQNAARSGVLKGSGGVRTAQGLKGGEGMNLFSPLGFEWNRAVIPHDVPVLRDEVCGRAPFTCSASVLSV